MSIADLLADHTYRMVFTGTTLIGLVAGALGVFAYLRRQSLISDVVSHAALPGALGGFLVAVVVLGIDGRSMVVLMVGAVITGTLAALAANAIPRISVVRIDAAMALVLTTFFAAGMLLLRYISDRPFPGKGGIQDYLFGNAAVLTRADLTTGVIVGALALGAVALCWKELTAHAFDPVHAGVAGFAPRVVDALMFTTIVVATVIGLKAVGIVLMVAFVVTPAAAARQWTRRLAPMVVLSAIIGGVSSGVGTYLSIALGGVPTGPLIVLTLAAIFLVSIAAAPGRSVIGRAVARRRAHLDLLAAVERRGGVGSTHLGSTRLGSAHDDAEAGR